MKKKKKHPLQKGTTFRCSCSLLILYLQIKQAIWRADLLQLTKYSCVFVEPFLILLFFLFSFLSHFIFLYYTHSLVLFCLSLNDPSLITVVFKFVLICRAELLLLISFSFFVGIKVKRIQKRISL